MSDKDFMEVSKWHSSQCPVCGKGDWCSVKQADDGIVVCCYRQTPSNHGVVESDEFKVLNKEERVDGKGDPYTIYFIPEQDEEQPKHKEKLNIPKYYLMDDPDYLYTDEEGNPVMGVWRFGHGKGKWFTQHAWIRGKWLVGGLMYTRPPLYRLPQVLQAAERGETVYITEGEKDVHTLEKVGLTATTAPMGAEKWEDSYSECLNGVDVVILGDMDSKGEAHVEKVAKSLEFHAKSIKVIEQYPGFIPGSGADVTDYLEAGGDLDKLLSQAVKWEPYGGNKDVLKTLTAEELAQGNFPMNWIIEGGGILAQEWLSLIIGEGGVGKSYLAVDMAFAIAKEKEWLGFKIAQNHNVLFLAGEGGYSSLQKRYLERLEVKSYQPGVGKDVHFWTPTADQNFKISEGTDLPLIINTIKRLGVGVLVIDPLTEFNTLEENSTKDMAYVLENCMEIIRRTGIAIIMLHHVNKASDKLLTMYDCRGSTTIPNKVSSMLGVSEPDGVKRIQFLKVREAEKPLDLLVKFPKGVFEVVGKVDPAHEKKGNTKVSDDEILKILEDRGGHLSPDEICEFVVRDISPDTMRKRLKKLAGKGVVEQITGERNRALFGLKG